MTKISQSVSWDKLVKRMLVLGDIDVIFLSTLRSLLAMAELIHAKKKKNKNRVISIREWNHIHVHYEVSIVDNTCNKINFQLMPT